MIEYLTPVRIHRWNDKSNIIFEDETGKEHEMVPRDFLDIIKRAAYLAPSMSGSIRGPYETYLINAKYPRIRLIKKLRSGKR